MFSWLLFFEPKSPLCKAYSLSMVANFGNFQKIVIFRILAVFWSRFFHRVTLMRSQCRYSNLFLNFIFLAKVTLLQSLPPFHSGQFWPFSKTCHFSNIRYFLKPFSAQSNSNEVPVSFFACFLDFYFLSQSHPFAKPIAFP